MCVCVWLDQQIGCTATYLVVLHDRPEILRFLATEAGVDMKKPCDPMGYGTAAFYAAQLGRAKIMVELLLLGVDLKRPCEKYGKDPYFVAELFGKMSHMEIVDALIALWNRSATQIQRIARGRQGREKFRIHKLRYMAARRIQAYMRGEVVRIRRGLKDDVKTRVAKRHANAIKIQALFRGELVRMKGLV